MEQVVEVPTMLAGRKLLGRYRLVRSLGAGGAASVHLAEDTAAQGRKVAIKLVGSAHAERLAWEFAVLRRLSHPNLAAVHEFVRFSQDAGLGAVAALVEEYVEGRNARDALQTQGLERKARVRSSLLVGAQVAAALAAVHRAGIIHGDIKPENIIVDEAGHATLVDLGMARRPGLYADISGTPGFMAPELLVGQVGFSADLYALGATLLALVSGIDQEQDASSEGLEVASVLRLAPAAPPRWLPASYSELLSDLLQPEYALRPSDAQAVAARLGQLLAEAGETIPEPIATVVGERTPSERAAALANLPLVGRDAEQKSLRDYLTQGADLVTVVGASGSGRSRLIREVVGEMQLLAARDGKPAPSFMHVDVVPVQPPEAPHTILAVVAQESETTRQALTALLRAARVAGRQLQVVMTCGEDVTFEPRVELGQLTVPDVRKLLQLAVPELSPSSAVVEQVTALCDGLPGRICALVAQGLTMSADLRRAGSWTRIAEELFAERRLPPPSARALFDVLLLCGGAVNAAALQLPEEQIAVELNVLRSTGWASIRADGLLALNEGIAAPGLVLSTRQRRDALAHVNEANLGAAAQGFVQLATRQHEAAAQSLAVAMAQRRAVGDVEGAVRLAQRALAWGVSGPLDHQLRCDLADGLRALADYQAAQEVLAPVLADDRAAQALAAELFRLSGARDKSRTIAEELAQGSDQPAATAHACLARLQMDAGDFVTAQQHVESAKSLAPACSAAHLRALEVEALTLALSGRWQEAVDKLVHELNNIQDTASAFRLHAALAYVYATAGESTQSVVHNRRAAELADAVGELHGSAIARVNAGSAALDRGELGVAVAELQAGASRLCRLGRDADLWQALYNLALARNLAGDAQSAEWLLTQASESATRASAPYASSVLGSFAAELALSRGQLGKARELLLRCPQPSGYPQYVAVMVWGRLLEVAAGLELTDQARQLAAEMASATHEDSADSVRGEAELAQGRVCALQGESNSARAHAERAVACARRAAQFELRLRTLLFFSRCCQEQGDRAGASDALSELRPLLEHAGEGLPPELLARMRAAPFYQAAFAATAQQRDARVDGAERLVVHAKRFLADQRLSRVFEKVLDAAIELSAAERGYLLTFDGEGGHRIRAARGLSRNSLPRDDEALSSSIVGQVLLSGRPLSTTDATTDVRLSSATSVHALSLRSVAALPLSWSGQIRGAIYLEDRLRPSAFDAPLLSLLVDLATLAGSAIHAAQTLQEQRRTLRRLSVARLRLARKVEAQSVELQSLREHQSDAGARHGMIGRNPELLRVLALASRAAKSELPLLVYGESGTGKELLARAVHAQSDRAQGPFVAENCGAVPETLLESTLFGHVRGAFTGADRNRRGLFELAHGGTLFLDEVGEMPLSMQVRLLRVMQDGEVRPVGAEKGRKVNVRVIAATHRDLQSMVADGTFRQDLYYRIAVVSLTLSALRDRPEDIPELAAHFAAQHAPERAARIDRRALDALCAYSWPGNVRQLENEIRRALLLADDEVTEAHLSPAVLGDLEGGLSPLDLHGQVAALERRLLHTALSQTAGNQSKAAERLGLSRYGLQKMMRRLGIELPNL